jgi:hypothetical protein
VTRIAVSILSSGRPLYHQPVRRRFLVNFVLAEALPLSLDRLILFVYFIVFSGVVPVPSITFRVIASLNVAVSPHLCLSRIDNSQTVVDGKSNVQLQENGSTMLQQI